MRAKHFETQLISIKKMLLSVFRIKNCPIGTEIKHDTALPIVYNLVIIFKTLIALDNNGNDTLLAVTDKTRTHLQRNYIREKFKTNIMKQVYLFFENNC